MKLIVRYCKPYAWRMLCGFLIKIVGTFADLGLPWVLSYILDEVVPLGEIRPVLYWGGFMLFLAFTARYCNIWANRKASLVARDVTRGVRHDLFVKTMALSGSQTDSLHIPSLVSRMTSDTYNIHQMVGMMQRLGVRAPMILVGGIIITLTMEPVLTLVLVVLLPILGALIFYISGKGIPLYKKVQSAMDSMVRIMRENISGIRMIKALSKTGYEKERFAAANRDMVER
ncbi:MAG: ABC transporter permease, partial [Lachnospiraceae bacterium]